MQLLLSGEEVPNNRVLTALQNRVHGGFQHPERIWITTEDMEKMPACCNKSRMGMFLNCLCFCFFQVYTINLESRYLLIQGVPALGVMKELVEQFALYGAIEEYHPLDEYPAEQFTEVYLIKFKKLQCARYWTGQYLPLAALMFYTFSTCNVLRF